MYAGLQLILPGETAPAHRHQAFALRFIVEGSRGFTAVSGEKVGMEKHDLILTPQWQWHDHGHDGDGPMIWLDGLDLPLYHMFPTHFAEPYHESRYPSKYVPYFNETIHVSILTMLRPTTDSPISFPWSRMRQALDAAPGDWASSIYRTAAGEYISKTLGAHAERLNADKTARLPRESCSFVYHVVQGNGSTQIELSKGTTETVEWTHGDTFAVPAWSRLSHSASSDEDVYLFALSDRPALDSLGMYVSQEGE